MNLFLYYYNIVILFIDKHSNTFINIFNPKKLNKAKFLLQKNNVSNQNGAIYKIFQVSSFKFSYFYLFSYNHLISI
jgi:hypothetical protein